LSAPLAKAAAFLRLDRSFWTPLLILATLAIAAWRMLLEAPAGALGNSTHESAAFAGGVLGGMLLPWAFGVLVAYGHWVWNKSRRDRDYMMTVYPYRRRVVLHATVLAVCALMLLEQIWRLAQGTAATG